MIGRLIRLLTIKQQAERTLMAVRCRYNAERLLWTRLYWTAESIGNPVARSL